MTEQNAQICECVSCRPPHCKSVHEGCDEQFVPHCVAHTAMLFASLMLLPSSIYSYALLFNCYKTFSSCPLIFLTRGFQKGTIENPPSIHCGDVWICTNTEAGQRTHTYTLLYIGHSIQLTLCWLAAVCPCSSVHWIWLWLVCSLVPRGGHEVPRVINVLCNLLVITPPGGI